MACTAFSFTFIHLHPDATDINQGKVHCRAYRYLRTHAHSGPLCSSLFVLLRPWLCLSCVGLYPSPSVLLLSTCQLYTNQRKHSNTHCHTASCLLCVASSCPVSLVLGLSTVTLRENTDQTWVDRAQATCSEPQCQQVCNPAQSTPVGVGFGNLKAGMGNVPMQRVKCNVGGRSTIFSTTYRVHC